MEVYKRKRNPLYPFEKEENRITVSNLRLEGTVLFSTARGMDYTIVDTVQDIPVRLCLFGSDTPNVSHNVIKLFESVIVWEENFKPVTGSPFSFWFNGEKVSTGKFYQVYFDTPTIVRGQRKVVNSVFWQFFPGPFGEICYKNPNRGSGYSLSPNISKHIVRIREVLNVFTER
jgi:hypothetical protein